MAEDTSATEPEWHLMKGETPTDGRDAAGRLPRENTVIHGDNLPVLRGLADETFQLIYVDPPFNTGKVQSRVTMRTCQVREPGAAGGAEGADSDGSPEPGGSLASRGANRKSDAAPSTAGSNSGSRVGFKGQSYKTIRGQVTSYNDEFADYWGFLAPRLEEAWRVLKPSGTLYLHLDYREVHYAKVLLDALFGRECFLNEIIWAYDYGARTKRRWPAKHDNILVYVKDPKQYYFDSESVDREPYMAPGLVTAEKAARGKLPTDVWWHTIVSPTGKEKTGYATQKPEGILRRIVAASSRPGDWVLDFFAGSGTTGAVAGKMGRHFVLVDENPQAIAVMRARFAAAGFPAVSFEESL
ncbi:DNA-methyltransferase [Mobiluncus mulieris]|uniref:DNA-methyltransferase n=1 Tax=Mobiluncus mulieris TaxID=2052 RepID=UPI00019F94CF|nr:site-specific DNA-methyltransferase [Mobiluncus mulieris]EEJ54607.1 DNA (cytosine-5-)-methyltransferase [Mobiluncus mulieris ATCC 35243]MCV0003418.1 site-specific DNA-methyltransferase [Mobiluncus mulieris]NMX01988.1 site-specific DNA-methyltransferase [Mobiluncus mulieris]NMX20464.1 site-specific DNA-methyltransferase [Mobiluncus mulieris]SPX76484.1 Modification methylase RsrI [Mobiluncus mulieris]